MASAADTRLVEMVLRDKFRANEYRQHFEPTWYRNWELYRNKGQTRRVRGQQWESNEELADGFRLVESMAPAHVRGSVRNYGWFWPIAASKAGDKYEQLIKALLMQSWRRAGCTPLLIEAIKYAHILGTVITHPRWHVELGEREVPDIAYDVDAEGEQVSPRFIRRTEPAVLYNGVKIDRPSLFHMWIDPTGMGRFYIERKYRPLAEMKWLNKEFDGRLYKNLDKLKSGSAAMPRSGQELYGSAEHMLGGGGVLDTPDLTQQVDGIPENLGARGDTVDMLHWEGWVDPDLKRYDDTQWRMLVVGNESELLRDEKIPTWDHRPKYIVTPAIPVPGLVYGESPLTMVEPLLRLKSFIENARRDEILLNMYQQWIIDRESRISSNDLLNMPGGAIFVNNYRGNLDQVIKPIDRRPVMPEAYNEALLKEEQTNRIAGVTEHMKGEGLGSRATATEAGIVNHSGSGRLDQSILWMDEMLKRPWLESMFKFAQVRLSQPEWVQLAHTPGQRYEITMWDLQDDVEIFVDSGIFGGFANQQIQTLLQAFQIFAGDPETSMVMRKPEIVRDIFYMGGMPFAERHAKTEEEILAEMEAARQQAERQALLEAELSAVSRGPGGGGAPAG